MRGGGGGGVSNKHCLLPFFHLTCNILIMGYFSTGIFWAYFVVSCLFVILVISHFGFEGRICLLIALVPVHCFLITFSIDFRVWFINCELWNVGNTWHWSLVSKSWTVKCGWWTVNCDQWLKLDIHFSSWIMNRELWPVVWIWYWFLASKSWTMNNELLNCVWIMNPWILNHVLWPLFKTWHSF